MQWDHLLARIREGGLDPVEEDFLDDYGQFAAGNVKNLRNRYFRCTFGRARVAGTTLEAYTFVSETEAADFLDLIRNDPGHWTRHRNVLLHVPANAGEVLETIRQLLDRPMSK